MKTISSIAISAMILLAAANVMAASGAGEETSLLLPLFIGFGILIIAFQFLPGMAMFCAMLKGLTSKTETEINAAQAESEERS